MPFRAGINEALEEAADAIITAAGGRATYWKDAGLLSPWRRECSPAHVGMLLVPMADITKRTGIFVRVANKSMPWLNSQPLFLGGRVDLIRSSGEYESTREQYEEEGTTGTGKFELWHEMMTIDDDNQKYRLRKAKNRSGAYVEPPWVVQRRQGQTK